MLKQWLQRHFQTRSEPDMPGHRANLPQKSSRPEAADAPSSYHLPPGLRVYAIGDIHGRLDLLMRLHAMIEADIAQRRVEMAQLVYLGDYIDRGSQSRQVIELLINPPPSLPRALMLRGNHEQTLLDCIDDPARLGDWRDFGGIETMLSYGVESALLRSRSDNATTMHAFAEACAPHLDFYESLGSSARIGDFFFCHAGIRPGIALDRQIDQDLLWIRQEFLNSTSEFGAMIVHGHTPVEKPDVRRNRVNIDTGAYVTRKLTAAVIEADQIGFLST